MECPAKHRDIGMARNHGNAHKKQTPHAARARAATNGSPHPRVLNPAPLFLLGRDQDAARQPQ